MIHESIPDPRSDPSSRRPPRAGRRRARTAQRAQTYALSSEKVKEVISAENYEGDTAIFGLSDTQWWNLQEPILTLWIFWH